MSHLPAPYASPLFAPLAHWLSQLPPVPDSAALRALAETHPVDCGNGLPVRFVPPQADGLAYECRVWERGEVETRPDNWHDFFNALVWLAFPKTKRAVTSAHVAAMQPHGAARGQIRDTLTHFDECGIVVLSTQPLLLDLLRQFAWKELFVTHRDAVRYSMRFIVFGHATYEALLSPFRGLTAKAILHEVTPDWLALDEQALLSKLDPWLATELASGRYARPRDFQPLPLLGIPGVTPESEQSQYYDDAWQFRPGRRAAAMAA